MFVTVDGVPKLLNPVKSLFSERKVETVEVATFFTKSKVAICCPVALVRAVGAVFTPVHALFEARNAFLVAVNEVWA